MNKNTSVVAVSNGVALLNSDLGEQIDSFEHVARFNNAALGPNFKRHVGSKTTIWGHCDWGIAPETASRFINCRRIFMVPDIPGKEHVLPPDDAEIVPRGFERELRQAAGISEGKWCTTGMTILAWLLEQYPMIHAAGWFVGSAGQEVREFIKHYDAPSQTRSWLEHDIRAERQHFQRWVEAGRIVPL